MNMFMQWYSADVRYVYLYCTFSIVIHV